MVYILFTARNQKKKSSLFRGAEHAIILCGNRQNIETTDANNVHLQSSAFGCSHQQRHHHHSSDGVAFDRRVKDSQ